MKILSPTGHLGFTPIERGSFEIGVSRGPDAIVADSGSCDIGLQPPGADEHCSPEEWQRHDPELMLLAARRLGVPMIVGSASDAGTDHGVSQYAEIIRELARRHALAPFTLATICSEVSRDEASRRLRSGVRVEGLDGRAERISAFVEFDPALAIKFTIRRERPSGSPGERDVFGAQQYAPLFDVPISL